MKRFLVATACVTVVSTASVRATDPVKDQVVATVGELPVHAGEIQRELLRVTAGHSVSPSRARSLAAATVQQAIKRRLVMAYLTRRGAAATPQEIDAELDRVRRKLGERRITLEAYLHSAGISEISLRHSLAWEISWPRFVKRFSSDTHLQKYYAKHHRDFDGTKLHVAHIFWKVDSRDEAGIDDALRSAAELRQQILAGEISFEDAARKYSAAPTKDEGGDIGFIERHQPMAPSFSRAAYQLQEGEISPPTTSPSGVHLIRCLRVEAGSRTWQDARVPVLQAVERYLFDWAVDRARPHAAISIDQTVVHAVADHVVAAQAEP